MLSLALYRPFGIAGVVVGTAISNASMTAQQIYFLRRELHGFEIARTIRGRPRRRSPRRGGRLAAYGLHHFLQDLLGGSLVAQILTSGSRSGRVRGLLRPRPARRGSRRP